MNTVSEELFAELPEDVRAVLSLFDDSYRFNSYFTWDPDCEKETGFMDMLTAEQPIGFMDMHTAGQPIFWSPGVNNPKDELVPEFIEWVRSGMVPTTKEEK